MTGWIFGIVFVSFCCKIVSKHLKERLIQEKTNTPQTVANSLPFNSSRCDLCLMIVVCHCEKRINPLYLLIISRHLIYTSLLLNVSIIGTYQWHLLFKLNELLKTTIAFVCILMAASVSKITVTMRRYTHTMA